MTKKKIVIIGPAYPYRGGNSLFVSSLYDVLKEQFDVKVINYKLLYPSFLFPGTTQYDRSETNIKKAPNERLINSINPFNWFSVAKRIKEEKADLVVFDWWQPFFGPCHRVISSLIKDTCKNKILFITENYISHEGSFIDHTLTKIGLKNASSFLTLSAKVAEELKTTAGDRKIYRSELPVYDCYQTGGDVTSEEAKVSFGFPRDSKVILFFGYVRKYKGLDLLLDAMPEIIKKDPSIKLLVAGEFYDEFEFYRGIIKKLDLSSSVYMINKFISNEEVYKYYEPADLVILPYRNGTQSGILNVAYGFLKPVLVTRVGGLAEFVDEGKSGFVIAPDSPEAIAEGVIKYFEAKKSFNFPEYISQKVSQNGFNDMPLLFKKIIEDSAK
ncbi:MAG: glycosyltransferase [Ignavibacteriales bacterium]|jgi:glycosyltransferase involved in cell wall biosynthesis|nr:glycosyltransferase [Ignavibacteriales bacterium]